MPSTRGRVLTLAVGERLVTETCYSCGVLFAMVEDFYDHRLADRKSFYCPNGHSQAYVGKTDSQKLKEAEARELALQDQLEASALELEKTRGELLRDRHRFANGVCPCCQRTFENVARHMASQHPDYDVSKVRGAHGTEREFKCSCGRSFHTLGGLHQHQTKQRGAGWFRPSTSKRAAHLTEVS